MSSHYKQTKQPKEKLKSLTSVMKNSYKLSVKRIFMLLQTACFLIFLFKCAPKTLKNRSCENIHTRNQNISQINLSVLTLTEYPFNLPIISEFIQKLFSHHAWQNGCQWEGNAIHFHFSYHILYFTVCEQPLESI